MCIYIVIILRGVLRRDKTTNVPVTGSTKKMNSSKNIIRVHKFIKIFLGHILK